MSWFASFFSTSKPPAAPPTQEQRILEEPKPSTHAPASIPALSSSTHSAAESRERQQPPHSTVDQPSRNKILFGAGLGFFALSILITRRSFTRRRLASKAAFYSDAPGHHVDQSKKVNGAMEALEALNIATINVLSVGMMASGGILWYLDINSMDDARRMLRGGLGVDGSGKTEKEAEEEFEEWMAATLARKDAKEKRKQDER